MIWISILPPVQVDTALFFENKHFTFPTLSVARSLYFHNSHHFAYQNNITILLICIKHIPADTQQIRDFSFHHPLSHLYVFYTKTKAMQKEARKKNCFLMLFTSYCRFISTLPLATSLVLMNFPIHFFTAFE